MIRPIFSVEDFICCLDFNRLFSFTGCTFECILRTKHSGGKKTPSLSSLEFFFYQISSPSVELPNDNKFAMDAVGRQCHHCLSMVSANLWSKETTFIKYTPCQCFGLFLHQEQFIRLDSVGKSAKALQKIEGFSYI